VFVSPPGQDPPPTLPPHWAPGHPSHPLLPPPYPGTLFFPPGPPNLTGAPPVSPPPTHPPPLRVGIPPKSRNLGWTPPRAPPLWLAQCQGIPQSPSGNQLLSETPAYFSRFASNPGPPPTFWTPDLGPGPPLRTTASFRPRPRTLVFFSCVAGNPVPPRRLFFPPPGPAPPPRRGPLSPEALCFFFFPLTKIASPGCKKDEESS